MRPLRTFVLLFIAAYVVSSCGDRNNDIPKIGTAVASATPFDTLNRSSFDGFICSDEMKIVEFGGKHCAPCNRMRERLIALQKEIPDLKLGLVFWEDCPELFQDQGVTYIPAQVVFDARGRETARHVGEWDMDEMKRALPGNNAE
jgi:thiol-disulfide isomerase/thioredoxin